MIVLMQWLHLLAAVVGVGAVVFYRVILLPGLSSFRPEDSNAVVERLARRFRMVIWSALVVLVFSGVFNLLESPRIAEPDYRYILGIKLVLAFLMFAIAFVVTLPLAALKRIQREQTALLTVYLVLAVVIIVISAYLRRF
jgi:uncharacterized membrane protein